MATYIMLASFTGQGIANVKETLKRSEAAKAAAKKAGATLKDLYWTLGQYDIVATFEAPDDETMTALGLIIGKAGNVRTQTLRAFSAAEMKGILGKSSRVDYTPNSATGDEMRLSEMTPAGSATPTVAQ